MASLKHARDENEANTLAFFPSRVVRTELDGRVTSACRTVSRGRTAAPKSHTNIYEFAGNVAHVLLL